MPSQQIVLKTLPKNEDGEWEIDHTDMRAFMRMIRPWKLPPHTKFRVVVDDESFRIIASFPKGVRYVNGKFIRLARKLKKDRAVEAQITSHRAKKAAGIKTAYVPPVGRTGPAKPKRVKCPVCNVRKPISKIGNVTTIKPHISGGEPCAGSGEQVGVGRK